MRRLGPLYAPAFRLRPESSQEHPPGSVAGVPSASLRTGSSTPRHTALCYATDLRSASLRACDFFDLACSLWLESWEEHLPTSIAGVLRLRAISRPLCDRCARRFAQDDGFVGGEKHPVSYAENTKRSKKSQALGMTKGRVAAGTPSIARVNLWRLPRLRRCRRF
jgi:hypothetical protein